MTVRNKYKIIPLKKLREAFRTKQKLQLVGIANKQKIDQKH